MRIWLAKVRNALAPTDDASRAVINRLGAGECVEVIVTRPRSVRWHRLYFALCREIGKNQDPPRDEDSIDYELRILAGHYDVMHVEGHEVRVPKRIAFDRMTHDQWNELWPRLEMAIAERFGPEYIKELAA